MGARAPQVCHCTLYSAVICAWFECVGVLGLVYVGESVRSPAGGGASGDACVCPSHRLIDARAAPVGGVAALSHRGVRRCRLCAQGHVTRHERGRRKAANALCRIESLTHAPRTLL